MKLTEGKLTPEVFITSSSLFIETFLFSAAIRRISCSLSDSYQTDNIRDEL